MGEQHQQRVLDPAELPAMAGNIGEDLLLDGRVRRSTKLDVHQPELAPDRVEERRPRVNRLRDVAR
jgi:hypothetical protein